MTKVFYIIQAWLQLIGCVIGESYLDPTVTYNFDRPAIEKEGEIYGYFGNIRVKNLCKDQIAMTFMINKGALSYNSGSFIDTLMYRESQPIYTDTEMDPSCKITFNFDSNGVTVKEETDDFNFGCGFGYAVAADGFYK